MGLFSWDCAICGHPLLSKPATNKVNGWMKQAIVFVKDKTRAVMKGEYDGYGRVGGSYDDDAESINDLHEPCCYHKACWEAAGTPGYTKASPSSADQGWFFTDPLHNMPKPTKPEDLPAQPVDYVCATWRQGMPRYDAETQQMFYRGPDRPMTLKAARRLACARLFKQVVRKHKHGHPVPAFHELEEAAAKLAG
jgi:hypothetical protein